MGLNRRKSLFSKPKRSLIRNSTKESIKIAHKIRKSSSSKQLIFQNIQMFDMKEFSGSEKRRSQFKQDQQKRVSESEQYKQVPITYHKETQKRLEKLCNESQNEKAKLEKFIDK